MDHVASSGSLQPPGPHALRNRRRGAHKGRGGHWRALIFVLEVADSGWLQNRYPVGALEHCLGNVRRVFGCKFCRNCQGVEVKDSGLGYRALNETLNAKINSCEQCFLVAEARKI